MNEWYARDTSKKVRAYIRAKGNSGKSTCGCPPYGYMKDENGKWVADKEIASIIRYAFDMYVDGESFAAIARVFNKRNVPTPVVWKNRIGLKYKLDNREYPEIWTGDIIRRIIKNPLYMGHTVNFRMKVESYKKKNAIRLPKEQWVVFKNTHEAIVDEQTFQAAQDRYDNRKRQERLSDEKHPLYGKLFCGECGKKMSFNRNKSGKSSFNCSGYLNEKKRECVSHHIFLDDVEQIVIDDLNSRLGTVDGKDSEFAKILQEQQIRLIKKECAKKQKTVVDCKKRIAELDDIIQGLYEDKVNGIVSPEQFVKLCQRYESEQAELSDKVQSLQGEMSLNKTNLSDAETFLDIVRQTTKITELTPDIVNTFISKIYVYKGEKAQGGTRQYLKIEYNCIRLLADKS